MGKIDFNCDRLELTKSFKKDMKSFNHNNRVKEALKPVIDILVNKKPIPDKYKPHPLTGDLKGFFDIHVLPDVVLVYIPDNDKVVLVRIGNHAKLKLTEQIIRLFIRE